MSFLRYDLLWLFTQLKQMFEHNFSSQSPNGAFTEPSRSLHGAFTEPSRRVGRMLRRRSDEARNRSNPFPWSWRVSLSLRRPCSHWRAVTWVLKSNLWPTAVQQFRERWKKKKKKPSRSPHGAFTEPLQSSPRGAALVEVNTEWLPYSTSRNDDLW